MSDLEFIVELEEGERLDSWLAAKVDDLSRSRIQSLIKKDAIRVNGKPARARQTMHSGDMVTVRIPEVVSVDLIPEDIPLDVLFEDEHLIAINKPAGLVVHPAVGNETGTLVQALLFHCKDLPGIGGEKRPGIIHRLDKDTSGIIVVAKTETSLIHVQTQFKDRQTKKGYIALVQNVPRFVSGTVDAPIGRHPQHRQKMSINDRGRHAVSHWTLEERFESAKAALFNVNIETGRTHQIRVHLHSINHAIIGDKIYRGKSQLHADRQMLHAAELTLTHPVSKELLELKAPMPDDFTTLIEELRGK